MTNRGQVFDDNEEFEKEFIAQDTQRELHDQDATPSRKKYKLAGAIAGVIAVGGIAGASAYAWASNEAKIEAKNSLHEGQLGERGFTESGIEIDVSGNTDLITIGCPGTVLKIEEDNQPRVSYNYNPDTMAAFWEVASQLDQSGQVIETFEPIVYPLETRIEVANFIEQDLDEACSAVASN